MKQYLCSHLVTLRWDGKETGANLEKIWSRGATVNSEEPIEAGVPIAIHAGAFVLTGTVVSCDGEPDGHFVEIAFESEWSPEAFQPEHLTDPLLYSR